MLNPRIIPALALILAASAPALGQAPAPNRATAPGPAPAGPSLGSGPAATALSPAGPQPPIAAPAAPEPPTEAETTLDEAIKRVQALKSVATDIRMDAEMLGQEFTLVGQYLRAPDYRIKLRLALEGLGDPKAQAIMQQVCDGTTLWDYQKVLDAQTYGRLRIQPILEKLKDPVFDQEFRERILYQQLNLSGPDALLVGLRKAIRFTTKSEDTLDGRPVWVLRGEWKDRASLNGPNAPPAMQVTSALPAYVPSLAEVTIGQEDGWPYKVKLEGRRPSVVEMRNDQPRTPGPGGGPVPAPKVEPSKLTLTYSNVKLNPELEPESFAFQAPPGEQPPDGTEPFLAFLDQAAVALANQKKAEEAAGKTPGGAQAPDILPPIEIPAQKK